MPKVGLEKFNVAGAFMGRTTFKGQIELDLWYEKSTDCFFFKNKDLLELFGEGEQYKGNQKVSETFFHKCKTRNEAINAMKFLLEEKPKKTKMLSIKIKMPSRLFMIPNPKKGKDRWADDKIKDEKLPEHLREMLDDIFAGSGIEITVGKVMKIESGEYVMYGDCNDDWSYDKNNCHQNTYRQLIEWTPERERFLTSIQEQMDILCTKVLDFFSTDSLEHLYVKMESNQKLLTTK